MELSEHNEEKKAQITQLQRGLELTQLTIRNLQEDNQRAAA
jgi:hypothetical protein